MALACARIGRPLLAGLLVLSLAARMAAATTVADAQHAYDAGHFEAARRIWADVAARGIPEEAAQAQLGLGLLYDLGQGVEADPVAAYGCYRRAADAGLAAAEFNVAVMNDSGTGTPRDLAAAATWYARAAARGHRRAQYNIAQLYKAGQGVPRNADVAATWLRIAASGNLAAAIDGRAQSRPVPSAPSPAATLSSLEPVTLVSPPAGETRSLASGRGVAFVWSAPPQPTPVRFFLEVVTQEANETRYVFARYVEPTAWLLDLPDQPARYAWRVYAVGDAGDKPDYAASAWSSFERR